VRLYGLKTCDTCRKAAKALPEAELVDLRERPLPPEVLAAALDTFGAALVNTRSTTWRGLTEEERQAPPAELLTRHPALMKRPLIEDGAQLHLGWTPEVRARFDLG
jgi:arsenate reductase